MKFHLYIILFFFGLNLLHAQTTKVAILDFENTSGKSEYDALGKAISSMLITDLANNIHPKKVEFFERSQLNKLLDEQKLQKSKNFDAKTAVNFGKLSGVNYVFVGSVFVLDGTCNFSSKLVDVQTSKILLAKDVSGKIESWLHLKSQLAEAIASQLNNPITLDPSYKNPTTSLATINQYGKILTSIDGGDADKAEQMRSLFEETNPDFKYFKELSNDIEELKKQVASNTAYIEKLKIYEINNNKFIDSLDFVNKNLQDETYDSEDSTKLREIYSNMYKSFKDSLISYNSNPGSNVKYKERSWVINKIFDWSYEMVKKEIVLIFESYRKDNPIVRTKYGQLNSAIRKEYALMIFNLLNKEEIPVKLNVILGKE
jgi:TolB-like protein